MRRTLTLILLGYSATALAQPASTLRLHPLRADGVSRQIATNAQAAVLAALRRASLETKVLAPLCRQATLKGQLPCLKRLASEGTVLHGSVTTVAGETRLVLYRMDAAGRSDGPVTIALAGGDEAFDAGLKAFPEVGRSDAPMATTAAQPALIPTTPTPETPGPEVPPEAVTVESWSNPRVNWLTPTGIAFLASGAALLAGGTTFAFINRGLSEELTEKHRRNLLTPADLPSYQRVQLYNVLATSMLIAGGAVAATGIVFVSVAPSGDGGTLSMSGRF
ncbi:MAG: hypothetical protein ACKVPX_17240 [Myxococcaceae bacterium]